MNNPRLNPAQFMSPGTIRRTLFRRSLLLISCLILAGLVASQLPEFIGQARSTKSKNTSTKLRRPASLPAATAQDQQPKEGDVITGTAGTATRSAVVNVSMLPQMLDSEPFQERPAHLKEAPMPLPIPELPPGTVIKNTEPEVHQPNTANPENQQSKTSRAAAPSPAATGFSAREDDGSIPPDTHGSVGPGHLLVTLNNSVRIQTRNGAVLNDVSLDDFWGGLYAPGAARDTFDPKSHYDPFRNRWMFTVCADRRSANSSIFIGVSQTADPTGNWNIYRIDADAGNAVWADFPSIGFNRDWIVVQVNMFNFGSGGTGFNRSHVYVLDKNDLYAGGTGRFTLLPVTGAGGTMSPAATYDNTQTVLHLLQNFNGNSGGNGFLRLYTVGGAVGLETLTVGAFVSTPNPWDFSGPGGDFAPQQGTTQRIQTNDSRMGNVVFRNGSIWGAQTVFLPAGGATRSSIQWWQVTPAGAIQQRARIDDPSGNTFFAFPSIAVNRNDDVLIGYSRYSATQFASAAYSFRNGTDPANMLCPDTLLKAGEASYFKTGSGTENRWGDYSHTVVDPLNDVNLWTIQEYTETAIGGDRWGTWWGQIALQDVADVAVIITDLPDPVIAGTDLIYTITVTNFGPATAAGVTMNTTVPANTTFGSLPDPAGWICLPPSGTGAITCTKSAAMASSEVTNFTLTVRVGAATPNGSIINGNATVSTTTMEPTTPNNSATATTMVITRADLELLGKADTPDPVVTNNPLTYTITLRNNGPSVSNSVVLADPLPIGAMFNNCVATGGGVCGVPGQNQTVTFTSLNVGATATITFNTTANCVLADGAVINNTVTVTASTVDPNLTNNSASAMTVAQNPPPVIMCPADRDVIALTPGSTSAVVTYPDPMVTDNCPGVVVTCNPPSNSSFPLGITTVTCVATDSGGATASCSFQVTVWDVCIQDDVGKDYVLFNSFTGDYKFVRCGLGGFTMIGKGRIYREGCVTRLSDDTRVDASYDRCGIAPRNTGQASIKRRQPDTTFRINDRNILNNSPTCSP